MASSETGIDPQSGLKKAPTGIQGLDEVTGGGLPVGRPTLICGSAGCGKTLLGTEFLVRGATQFGEPGVFITFEETADELTQNVKSMGFHLDTLVTEKKLRIDHIRVERSEIEETGEYDLDGLFVRLAYAVNSIGAKRIVLDTLESLFSGFSNIAILRSELRRLFRWLKDQGLTAIITAERGDGTLTRNGLEEYVSDCVILLDHRVIEQMSTRRLRIVKYRGSGHDTNEFPFLIGDDGISVLPITSARLDHEAPTERVSSGIFRLDAMLGGKGYYRGSSILISGTAGTGKTSIAAHFASASCARGERCLYFAFEESPKQLVRNMRSIGLDLQPWIDKRLLMIHSARPSLHGLEMHLAVLHKTIRDFQPQGIVIDPVSNFTASGTAIDSRSMLTRLIDFLKTEQITSVFTSLVGGSVSLEQTDVGICSIIDTWLFVRDLEMNGERNRGLYLLKSRGMPHSNQIREFIMTNNGIELADIYYRSDGLLCGSARHAQEAADIAASQARQKATESRNRQLNVRRKVIESQIEALKAGFEAEADEIERLNFEESENEKEIWSARAEIARRKGAEADRTGTKVNPKDGL